MKKRLLCVALVMLIVTTGSYGRSESFIELIAVPKGTTLTVDTSKTYGLPSVIKEPKYSGSYNAILSGGVYFTDNFSIPLGSYAYHKFTTSQGTFYVSAKDSGGERIFVTKEGTDEVKELPRGRYGMVVECDGSLSFYQYQGK